jgi:O-acetyl-ADP-ribose deacetylase (regulator of RNase III)
MKKMDFCFERITLTEGDITQIPADAIVNAANKSLILGGGVAGAIRRTGGPAIQVECSRIGPIKVGEAVLTGAGNLKAKYIIHAVGPVFGEGDEDRKLADATVNSLKIASKRRLESLAFPAVSTGIYHFPIEQCSQIMLKSTLNFLINHEYPGQVIFCLYEEAAFSVFQNTLSQLSRCSS